MRPEQVSGLYSWRQTALVYQLCVIQNFRDKTWGQKDVEEPDWDELFGDKEERKTVVQSKIEQQKRLIAEARARNGGKLGRS